MDDQQAYLLNGLISRHFDLGRVVRFREVPRGRQAATIELLSAQGAEYLVQLFPPAFEAGSLDQMAEKVNRLDKERFSVVPFVRRKGAQGDLEFVAEGPQG